MSRATPQMLVLAQSLIAYEARGDKSAETKAGAAFRVCERLRPYLATFMGTTGFRSLLARALALANAEVAWLRSVDLKPDGSLEGLHELEARVDREKLEKGSVVLVAQLLGLLVAFIGEKLTLHLVRDIWPKLSLNGFEKGDKK
jgi:hypothetical protein